MAKNALVLFAHGSRDPDWAAPFRRVRDVVRSRSAGLRVELSFLELMPPSLPDVVGSLVAEGYDAIRVVPMFLAQGGHLKEDLPKIIDELRAAHPQVSFVLSRPLGEVDAIVEAMADYVAGQGA